MSGWGGRRGKGMGKKERGVGGRGGGKDSGERVGKERKEKMEEDMT